MGLVSRARPDPVRLLGVNTEASPGMWLSRRDGFAHLELDSAPTIAEGLEGGVGEITYRMGLENIDDMLVVPEATIRRAVAGVAAHDHLIVEGSGAAAVAAVMEGLVKGERICVLLTGGNIDMSLFRKLLEEYDYSATPDPKNLGGSSRV
jgi:threonine dehydratase